MVEKNTSFSPVRTFREEWAKYKKKNNISSDMPRKAGSAKGLIKMSEDFDDPIEDFKESM